MTALNTKEVQPLNDFGFVSLWIPVLDQYVLSVQIWHGGVQQDKNEQILKLPP